MMLDYLDKYNLTSEQIKDIEQALIERGENIEHYQYNPEIIMETLDLFADIGVTNIYGIMMIPSSIFHSTMRSLKNRINSYGNKEQLAKLLNEDAENLSLIGLI